MVEVSSERRRGGLSRLGALLLLAASSLSAPESAVSAEREGISRQVVHPAVTVRPVPITTESKPFLASPLDLRSRGYVQEEFFISGQARAYDWVGETLKIKAVTSPGAYVTRILVIRPADPKRFSGNVEVEMLNATTGMDITTTMGTSADYLMRRGDAWVGVTSKPLSLGALKRFDPARYAGLMWSNPAPPDRRCDKPSIIPEYLMGPREKLPELPALSFPDSEDGLVWDIFAQLGALLKSEKRAEILPGFAKPRLFATGYSQSGSLQVTFINGFHDVMRLPGGEPIFDGYLVEVGPVMLRINQCSKDVLLAEPRNTIHPTDVPVINIVSEGDMWLGLRTRRPDVVGPRAGVVTYEIAGASHKHGFGAAGRPSAEEASRAGAGALAMPAPSVILNDFPRAYLSTGALRNLQEWAIDGRAPPQARLIDADGSGLLRDSDGNALGGVRTPWLDVPVATYRGALGDAALGLVGSKTPFAPEKLQALYPTHAAYVAKVQASVERLVAERWIVAEDAPAILADADARPVP